MSLDLSRRQLLVAGGALAAAPIAGVAEARIAPSSLQPLIGPGYRPTDRDELGMWQQMERVEEEIAGSNLLIADAGRPARVQVDVPADVVIGAEIVGPLGDQHLAFLRRWR